MEEQTRRHKGAVSKRPRDGSEGWCLVSVYCVLQQNAGFSSHSHLFTPHSQPTRSGHDPNFTDEEVEAQVVTHPRTSCQEGEGRGGARFLSPQSPCSSHYTLPETP